MPSWRSSGAWSRVRAIIGREFAQRVRSGWFVAGTLLGPTLMLALIALPLLMAGAGPVPGTLFLAFGLWFLLYTAIMLYGIQVMTSVVEEKTTRLAEVLFTSVAPWQALAGKIAGIGAVGLLQMTIWVVGAWVLLAAAGIDVPALSASLVLLALGYFLLGYLQYAALFGGIGALVSSDAEARQAQIPVIVLLMVPSALMVGILAEPDGTLARVLSLVPFTSPIAMPVRVAAGGGSAGECVVSLVLLALTVVAVMWAADRVYRAGMLVHGRRIRLGQAVKWVIGRAGRRSDA